MDTQAAILALQNLSQNIGAQIGQLTNEQEAVNVAVQLLQGTLATQLAELETTKEALDAATTQIDTLRPEPLTIDPAPIQ